MTNLITRQKNKCSGLQTNTPASIPCHRHASWLFHLKRPSGCYEQCCSSEFCSWCSCADPDSALFFTLVLSIVFVEVLRPMRRLRLTVCLQCLVVACMRLRSRRMLVNTSPRDRSWCEAGPGADTSLVACLSRPTWSPSHHTARVSGLERTKMRKLSPPPQGTRGQVRYGGFSVVLRVTDHLRRK